VEPGSGMLNKAKQVCRDYDEDRVEFHHVTLQEFVDQTQEEECYDTIMAATSFHWAMDSKGEIVKRCHSLLKPHGKLILLWNIPPEPGESAREAVAAATSQATPFYFGGYSVAQNVDNIREKILRPVQETGLFSSFSFEEYPTQTRVEIPNYLSMVRTFSPYIQMTNEDRNVFFAAAQMTMTQLCGSSVDTTGLSILNVSSKLT